MPYYITADDDNASGVYSPEHAFASPEDPFFFAVWLGKELTKDEMAAKPQTLAITINDVAEVPSIWGGGMQPWYVDETIKDILSDIEPGRHNFIPIRLTREDSMPTQRNFFLLHVTAAIEAIIIEHTRFAAGVGSDAYEHVQQLVESGPIVLDSTSIANRHLWRGKEWNTHEYNHLAFSYFCSDQLADEIRKISNIQIRFHECQLR